MDIVHGIQKSKITQVGLILILILGLGYCFILSSHFEQLELLKKQELILRRDLQKKHREAAHLKEYQQQLKSLKKRLTRLSHQMPMEEEMHQLLDDLSVLGTSTGLSLSSFSPESEIAHDDSIELPIKSTLIGTYRQLALFVSHMAAMNRMLVVTELTMSKIPSWEKKRMSGEEVMMTITTSIYRYQL